MKKPSAFFAMLLTMCIMSFPIAMLKGCGTNDMCGGCPSDSIAPYGSVITAPKDETYNVTAGSFYCVNNLTFTLTDSNNNPLNGLCVEVFTNGLVALASGSDECTNNTTNYVGYMRTRTDAGGTLSLDFATPTLNCSSGATSGSTEDQSFFVQVTSCSATDTWTGTWRISCP